MYYTDIPKSSLSDRLDFRMPDFTKVMYASGKVIEHWQIRVAEASNAWSEIEKATITHGLRDSILIYINTGKFLETKRWADKHGLIVVPLHYADVSDYSSYGNNGGTSSMRVAITRTKEVAGVWMTAWKDSDNKKIGELLGFPECCCDFFEKYWVNEGYRDLTYPAYHNSESADGDPAANILGRWVGVRLVSHMPCSFGCKHSIEIGRQNRDLGIEIGYKDQVEDIISFLSLPYKYSSMKGIAEISNPIWKVSAASESYPREMAFNRQGDNLEFTASGKEFPFSNQAKSSPSQSPSFKRAMEHYQEAHSNLNAVDEKPDISEFDVKPHLNGFSSEEAQKLSHEVILRAVEGAGDSVYDFGCGNGALISKISKLYGHKVSGCDTNKEAILFGKLEWDLDISDENMFFSNPNGYDTAIIMPGRLTEVDDEVADAFAERINDFKFIIAYGYSDWKDDIESIISTYMPGLIEIDREESDSAIAIKYQVI